MNLLRTIAATVVVFGFAGPAHAQSEQGSDILGGIQSTIGEFVSDAFEDVPTRYQQFVRSYWLMNSDIRMTMKAHDAGTGTTDYGDVREVIGGPLDLFAFSQEASDSTLYAEFDWQNRAMSMRATDDASSGYVEFVPLAERLSTDSDATDVTMYFDAAGNVYVPTGTDSSGNALYTGVNFADAIGGAFGTLAFGIEAAIDSRAAEFLDSVGFLAYIAWEAGLALPDLVPEGVADLVREYDVTYDENEGEWSFDQQATMEYRLGLLLVDLARARYEILANYPLVNFAFIFSPTLVRSYDNIREEPTTWAGRDGATKFTVTSGDDAGYVIIFDGAGRLVLLKDTDGSTAEYMYDMDVTVP